MSKKNYDEASVIRSLSRKNSCSINYGMQRVIEVEKDGDLGNGSWGKIDYLVNYCGYSVVRVAFISRGRRYKDNETDKKIVTTTKVIDMASMAKAEMNKVKIPKAR